MATFTHDHVHLRSPDPEATAHNVRIAFLPGPQSVSIELIDRNAP